jgi:hypothetical protein
MFKFRYRTQIGNCWGGTCTEHEANTLYRGGIGAAAPLAFQYPSRCQRERLVVFDSDPGILDKHEKGA